MGLGTTDEPKQFFLHLTPVISIKENKNKLVKLIYLGNIC